MSKRVRRVVIIVALLILSYAILHPRQSEGAVQVRCVVPPTSKTSAKVYLDGIVEDLMQCESSGKPSAINPDDGGSPSYGCLQYKRTTFLEGIEKHLLLREAEASERENFLMDCEVQQKLARKMLSSNVNGWKHWRNCFKGIDKPNACVVE